MCLLVFIFGLGFASSAYAAAYYWVGGTTNSNTSNPANWNTTAGACVDSANLNVPGAADSVYFDSTCLNNATINSAFSVLNFTMNTGYTGTITQNNTTLTVASAGSIMINTGTLNVTNGGTVNAGLVYIDSGGTVTVSGAGSTWTSSGHITVSNVSTGTLNILNGAAVSTTGSLTIRIGGGAGSNGTVTLDGAGSILTTLSYLQVGRSGTGTLNITNGGAAHSGTGYVGSNAGSTGTVTIDGVGSEWDSSSFIVGASGTGTVTISNGGAKSNTYSHIGDGVGSMGTVTIKDTGSTWTLSNDLTIGYSGTGTLTMQDGALMNLTGVVGTRTVLVASEIGSTGTLNIGAGYTTDVIQAATITAGSGTAFFPPAKPTGLTDTRTSDTSIVWDWDDMARATGYKVYRTSNNALLTTIDSATSNWTQDSLSSNSSFSVYVRGTNANGEGAASNGYSVSTDTRDLNVNKIKSISTYNSITLTWKTDYNAKSTVRYGTNKNLKEKKKDNQKEKNHKVILKNLLSDTQYYFRIKSEDGNDNTDSSKIHSIKTQPAKIQPVETQNLASLRSSDAPLVETPKLGVSTTDLKPNICNYTVQSGDTLWRIAQQVYGDAAAYPLIIEKNKDKYPNISSSLSIGQELTFGCSNENQSAVEGASDIKDNAGNNNPETPNPGSPPEGGFKWWNPWSWF